MPSDATAVPGTIPPGAIPPGLAFFYVPPGAIAGDAAHIEGEEFAHLTQVMRFREGETIGIVDGAGMAYVAEITSIQKHNAVCAVRSTHPNLHEPARHLTLAVGLLKNPSRFEIVVEKCTELGVRKIIPLITARTIQRHARVERWRSIALAAMKQCGRCVLPDIAPLTAFDALVTGAKGWNVMCHEQASLLFETCATGPALSESTVCIGPEGGFTEAEVAMAGGHGWTVVSMGNRRLRTETAAIVATARLLSF
jgi:16S rRNA (uracil1498-N3)-methyltransferase